MLDTTNLGKWNANDSQVDVADFLPDPGHPLYNAVLAELIRVDLEYGWQRGQPTPLSEYDTPVLLWPG